MKVGLPLQYLILYVLDAEHSKPTKLIARPAIKHACWTANCQVFNIAAILETSFGQLALTARIKQVTGK